MNGAMIKPYYDHAGITIYHGDCRNILPHLPRVDLVLTDPPYGVGCKRGDTKLSEHIFGDDTPFDPSHLLKLNVPMILWGGNAYAHRLPSSNSWLIWDKTFPECAKHSQAELAWTNLSIGVRIHREAYHGFMRQRDGWLHPMQKPPKLMSWCIGFLPEGAICDPYMGSGPILLAAKRLGRICTGIEIEEKYCEIAVQRLSQEVLAL